MNYIQNCFSVPISRERDITASESKSPPTTKHNRVSLPNVAAQSYFKQVLLNFNSATIFLTLHPSGIVNFTQNYHYTG